MVDAELCVCIADVGFIWLCVDLHHYPVIMVSFNTWIYLKAQKRVPLVLSSSLLWVSDCVFLWLITLLTIIALDDTRSALLVYVRRAYQSGLDTY